jgi:hypothetical protein
MELLLIMPMFYAFLAGLIVGTGLFCTGLMIGKMQSQGGVIKTVFGKKEKELAPEDIPGTDAYYEKALLSPEEGGHADVADPFEQELIQLNRHAE